MTVEVGAPSTDGGRRKSFRSVSLLAILLAGTCLTPMAALAQTTNNWLGVNSTYTNTANWQLGTVPLASETAVFGTTGTSTVLISGGGTSVGGWQFNTGAPAYLFTLNTTLQFLGSGITKSTTSTPSINVIATGDLIFANSSSVGRINIQNIANGAKTTFKDSSSAGTAIINSTTTGASLFFQDSASAGSAVINNGGGNTVSFTGSASAGSATISNAAGGSVISFAGSTTAGSATITSSGGGKTSFTGSSTGGQARLIANVASFVDISGLSTSGMAAGSIEGAGTFRLGSKQLTVGSTNTSFNVAGSIVDGGDSGGTGSSLVKTGTGTMSLTGNSTYTGGTTISGGTLQIGANGTTGSITGNVVNNATLVFARSNNTTFGGIISGTGSLQQTGTGLLILSGANTYTGGTTISRGTLQIGLAGGPAVGIAGNVTNTATLQILNADTSGLASITTSGNGVSVFFGSSSAGTATLTTNSGGFTGFRANSTGGQAQFVTNAGGTVDISGLASGGMTAGSIEGAGSYNLGSKQLTVGGNNLSTTVGGVIADGGLSGGTGASLVKTGTGTLTLSGNNTFTGGTTVNQGLLVVNGSLASGVTLSGGSLGGSGSVAGLTANNATIAPGNSIGTLTVSGNFVQNGGTYQVETNAQGQSDRINVAGSATINGTAVQVLAQSGTYARQTTYTILNATGGVAGTYSSVSSNFAFLTPTLSYDANNVYLTLAQSQGAFAAGAQTPNQYAVGVVLDQVNAGATGDLYDVLNALSVLSNTQGPAALNAISGQPYADFGTTNLQGAALFMSVVGQQMAAARGIAVGGQRQALAQACEIEACDRASRWSAWANAFGGLGAVAGNGNASTLTYNFGGGAAGIDYRLDPGLLVGFAAGYASGNQWVDSFMGRGWSDTVSATVYGSFAYQNFYADGLAGYAYSGNQMQRQIMIPGLQPRTANGGTGANQFFGQVEGGYRLPVFAPAQATATPFARLQAATVTQNGFSEWGNAQSIGLNVAPQTTNSLRTALGATLAGAIGLGEQRTLDLALRLGWLHEFADTARPITAAFAGAPYNAFTVYGASPQRDSAAIGFSAGTLVADAVQLYLRYDGELSTGASNHTLNLGVRVSW